MSLILQTAGAVCGQLVLYMCIIQGSHVTCSHAHTAGKLLRGQLQDKAVCAQVEAGSKLFAKTYGGTSRMATGMHAVADNPCAALRTPAQRRFGVLNDLCAMWRAKKVGVALLTKV